VGSGSDVRAEVAAEVRLHRLTKCVNGGRDAGKTVGYVPRGAGSEGGIGVGVTVEVGSARVKAIVRDEVERRENPKVRIAGRGFPKCDNIRTWVPP